MKIKWMGDGSITIREVTFEKGKPVDLSQAPDLAEKVLRIPGFAAVKGRKRNDQNDA